MRIIDTHVHLYPNEVSWRFRIWIEKKLKQKLSIEVEWDKALKKLRELGVESVFNLTHSTTPDDVELLNRWQKYLKDKYGFVTFGAFHPKRDIDVLIDAFKRDEIDGLKLHPSVQKFYPNSREAIEIYEVLEEFKKPLYIHAGWFPDNGYEYSSPEMYETLVQCYDFPVVIAHMILGKCKEITRFLEERKNVYTDTSSILVEIEAISLNGVKVQMYCEYIRDVIELFPERVMFGSDIPFVWWSVEETIQKLKEICGDEVERITYLNAKRFIEKHIR